MSDTEPSTEVSGLPIEAERFEETYEENIDELRDQLGLGGIEHTLRAMNEKIANLEAVASNRNPEPGVNSVNSPPASMFDPTEDLSGVNVPSTEPNAKTLESSEFLPSIFEETETFGPEVSEVVAKRINDSVSKKPLETKFKEIQDKYKTPQNCRLLCVPKVNLELWHDLPRNTKTKDLGLQEIQKNLVKAAQPMVQLLDSVLKNRSEKKPIEMATVIPLVADAVTLLGHASYLTSLKRREFLKPDIAQAYQSVCSKSNPMSTYLFGDELPKHIKEISEVNKIAKKTMSRTHGHASSRRSGYHNDYKSNSAHGRYSQRGGRRHFLGYGNKAAYAERRQPTHQSTTNTKVYRDTTKDKA